MPNVPRVSIVSPMYNSGKFLALTIESILAQTMADFELILSDDGSSDDSVQIGEKFAALDPRVKIVRNPHRGIAATRNAGLAATDKRSEFITLFDSDDLWEKHAAATLVAALEKNPRAPAAHCVCMCVDPNGEPFPNDDHAQNMRNRRAMVDGRIVPVPRSAPTSFGALLLANYPTTPGTTMVRRSAFDAVGPYDASTEPLDDWDMNLRLSRLGDIVFVDEILLSWRRHSMAMSNVSTRLRKAYLIAWRRTIAAPENTPAQRGAARTVLRTEIFTLQKEAWREFLGGGFRAGAKKLGRSLLLGPAYFGVRVPFAS